MGVFTEAEVAYLNSQRLGRLATAVDGRPHVVPVVFQYNPDEDTIDIGGRSFAQGKKFRDVQANPNVAFVVDGGARLNSTEFLNPTPELRSQNLDPSTTTGQLKERRFLRRQGLRQPVPNCRLPDVLSESHRSGR
jgi:Pyridoxamine 5'-phosphate oxidase